MPRNFETLLIFSSFGYYIKIDYVIGHDVIDQPDIASIYRAPYGKVHTLKTYLQIFIALSPSSHTDKIPINFIRKHNLRLLY